jgi:hypothetical protein
MIRAWKLAIASLVIGGCTALALALRWALRVAQEA